MNKILNKYCLILGCLNKKCNNVLCKEHFKIKHIKEYKTTIEKLEKLVEQQKKELDFWKKGDKL